MIKHLAIIMDGNRRWAKKNGLKSFLGHKYGAEAAKRTVEFCLQENIRYLSLYTLSIENLNNRSEIEKEFIFSLLIDEATNYIEEYKKKGVRVKFVGDRSLYPEKVIPACNKIEEETKLGNILQVNLLFCYGARQEILSSVKSIVRRVISGEISQADITDELFTKSLWTNGTPEPELIIRTGSVHRLSNFLLYQAAYSEFYFLDCMWPEIETHHLEKALSKFKACQRNFGV
jgi:undecaprenyl diphosphate synthase